MAKEIWLWLKEMAGKALGGLGGWLRKLWRYLMGWLSTVSGSTWRKVAIAVPVLVFLYIVLGMMVVHRVDDSMDDVPAAPKGGSQAVTTVAYLVRREAMDHNWTPNDPIFLPGWWVDNTPNYQMGLKSALERFSFELRDQLGRMRGSSTVDENLQRAASGLGIEPDRWVIDFSTSMLPTRPSDSFYKEAVKELEAYNVRLVQGDAIFERRADNFLATIDRIALDLGASSAALEQYVGENAGGVLPDLGADDLFYQVKGQVYGYLMILKALRQDFPNVIEDRELGALYDELISSMTRAAMLDPILVSNGAADGLAANHLSVQGFYLLRARTQLREVSNILLK
ncbi:DUF2333 family protein [Kordiimonas lacus]|uniref:DUF2333 domain-containing protein n=1 Tax=Kordiimonas lacus TaxID=637679 RepID=A0A1G6TRJ2_9PROT|nr:DUF2333 family protein [Kordiimonas lacus]SDD31690.1 hypothetical protein SAMN04488071_0330 [Kordiimonas lacus]